MPYSAHDEVVFALLVFVFSAIMSYAGRSFIILVLNILRLVWKAARRLVVRSKRTYIVYYIVYNHAKNHHLVTDVHNEPLFYCMNNPCDTLFVDAESLNILPDQKV